MDGKQKVSSTGDDEHSSAQPAPLEELSLLYTGLQRDNVGGGLLRKRIPQDSGAYKHAVCHGGINSCFDLEEWYIFFNSHPPASRILLSVAGA